MNDAAGEAGADLDPDRIAAARGDGELGHRVSVFRETASTNDLVTRMALDGVAEGMVVVADRQTRGRGQHGRVWHSPGGCGLWFSVLLRPEWPRGTLEGLTPLVAVCVARAVAAVGLGAVRIKPPNDIYAGGRKLAGILTEARSGKETFAVVGVGLNVGQRMEDFPEDLRGIATSLALELGRSVARETVLAEVLRELNAAYRRTVPPGEDVALAFAELSRRPDCGSFRA